MIKKIKAKFEARKIRRAQKREYMRNVPSSFDHAIISWTAQEYLKFEKGKTWKFVVALAIVGAALWGFLNQSWTFSLAIIAFAIAYFVVHMEESGEVEVVISEIGIKVGGRRYSFSKIRAFWIVYEPPFVKSLHIRVPGDLAGDIEIQLGDQNPAKVRELLIGKIPELEGEQIPFSTALARLFKL